MISFLCRIAVVTVAGLTLTACQADVGSSGSNSPAFGGSDSPPSNSDGGGPNPNGGDAGSARTTAPSGGTLDASRADGETTEKVDCDTIDSDVTVTARGGETRWRAIAKRGPGLADAGAIGVQTDPASGDLDEGQSVVVHVSGTLNPNSSQSKSGDYFDVLFAWPNSTGSGSIAMEFQCS